MDPVLHAIGLHACDPWWRLGPERTRAWGDLDLWLLLEGSGRVATPAGEIALAPGACLVLRGGEAYDFAQEPRRRFRHWYAHFSLRDAAGAALPPTACPLPLHRRLEGHGFLAGLLERARDAWEGGDAAGGPWFAAALAEVARADAAVAQPAPRAAARMREAAARLRSDPAHAPSVAALAAAAGMTPGHFTRAFRAAIGMTPRACLVAARLDLARHLLRDTALSVAQVSASCGFADPAFFGRHFRRHAGCSPGGWRSSRFSPNREGTRGW